MAVSKNRMEPTWWTALSTSPCRGGRWNPGGQNGQRRRCHFLAGPENRLVEVAVRSSWPSRPTPPQGLPAAAQRPAQLRLQSAGALRPQRHGQIASGPGPGGGMEDAYPAAAGRQRGGARMPRVAARGLHHGGRFRPRTGRGDRDPGRRGVSHQASRRSLLVVEDLGLLATRKAGKLSAQEELIHTLDALLAEERWVIVTASAAPAELPGILPALQEPLERRTDDFLAPPGPEARLAIIRQLATLKKLDLPEPVAQLLADGLVRHGPRVGRFAVGAGNTRPTAAQAAGPAPRQAISGRAKSCAAADAARDRAGDGAALFAATGRTAESGRGGGRWCWPAAWPSILPAA